jgi:transcriptional regulator of acetoin/glycerol metabolism
VDVDKLRREVLSIQGRDYYFCDGDLDEDAFGVSAPIFNHLGHIIGAVNVSGPSSRGTKAQVDGFIDVVRKTGAAISRELGYQSRASSPQPANASSVVNTDATAGQAAPALRARHKGRARAVGRHRR